MPTGNLFTEEKASIFLCLSVPLQIFKMNSVNAIMNSEAHVFMHLGNFASNIFWNGNINNIV